MKNNVNFCCEKKKLIANFNIKAQNYQHSCLQYMINKWFDIISMSENPKLLL